MHVGGTSSLRIAPSTSEDLLISRSETTLAFDGAIVLSALFSPFVFPGGSGVVLAGMLPRGIGSIVLGLLYSVAMAAVIAFSMAVQLGSIPFILPARHKESVS
jgi:hypothetical protein